jgi:hypothetical protein
VLRADIDEVEESCTAIRFGEEESGIGLGIRGLDPLKAGPNGAVIAAAFAKNPAAIAAHPHGHPYSCSIFREREGEEGLMMLGCGELELERGSI